MDLITVSAISVGIFSALWAFISDALGLLTWVGFIGFTSYFASGGKAVGLKKSIVANITGIIWAMCIIGGTNYFGSPYISYILTGFFSFVMCFQSKAKPLTFIPGAFLGACSTFGTNGNWKIVLISIIVGNLIGRLSDIVGLLMHGKFGKED